MTATSLGGVFDRMRRFARQPNAVAIGLAAAFVAVIGFAGYKIYELKVTGGVGFVNARELAVQPETHIAQKKQSFFDALRPIVEAENGRILELRERLITAREIGEGPAWVRDVARDYGVAWSGGEWGALLRRVDAVPMALALAQSANESNWGQSRFAQEGNNLFGQWCFEPGCGIVPKQRPEGAVYEVEAFGSVNESVRAYLNNINTHPAYEALRRTRAQARAEGRTASAIELAAGLGGYSERGDEYIKEIRATIRFNREMMVTAQTE